MVTIALYVKLRKAKKLLMLMQFFLSVLKGRKYIAFVLLLSRTCLVLLNEIPQVRIEGL